MFHGKIIINQEIFIFQTLKKGTNYTLIDLSFFLLSFKSLVKQMFDESLLNGPY